MFYDRFVQLCAARNISPSRAAIEAGLSKSTVTKWKTSPDSRPTGAAIDKLTEYFGITISELLGEETEKAPADHGKRSISDDDIMFALWGDTDDVDKDDLDDVMRYAAFVRERKKAKK